MDMAQILMILQIQQDHFNGIALNPTTDATITIHWSGEGTADTESINGS